MAAYGLTGTPVTIQNAMNTNMFPLLRNRVLVVFDDILIYSKSLEEHLQHIRIVFQLLTKDQWHLKLSKCVFAQTSISYL